MLYELYEQSGKGSAPVRRISCQASARIAFCVAAVLLTGGCVETYNGAPQPIHVYQIDKTTGQPTARLDIGDDCPNAADIKAFGAGSPPANLTRAQWRNEIVDDCIDRADSSYQFFTAALHRESAITSTAFDLSGLALSGLGSVSSKSTANALSAAATGLAGANTAINKDVFYQKTIPALIAQMDASREKVHTAIVASESQDPQAQIYTLSKAQHDIRNYQAAGSIDNAIGAITSSAQQSAAQSVTDAQVLETATVLDPDSFAFQKSVAVCVQAITATSKADMDAIAAALGVTIDPAETFAIERRNVRNALSMVNGATAVAKVSTALKSTKCPGGPA